MCRDNAIKPDKKWRSTTSKSQIHSLRKSCSCDELASLRARISQVYF